MLVLGTSLLTFTTTPNELTDGLDKSLGFLNKVGVPVHEIAIDDVNRTKIYSKS